MAYVSKSSEKILNFIAAHPNVTVDELRKSFTLNTEIEALTKSKMIDTATRCGSPRNKTVYYATAKGKAYLNLK